MITAGFVLIGWLAPELLTAFGKVEVPMPMNFMCAIAFGLIAAGVQGA